VHKHLCKLTGTSQRIISANHPQSNGLVERQNRSNLMGLRKLKANQTDWDIKLYTIAFANNTMSKRAHGFKSTPFELMFWRKAKLACNMEEQKEQMEDESDLKELIEKSIEEMKPIQETALTGSRKSIIKEQVTILFDLIILCDRKSKKRIMILERLVHLPFSKKENKF
jgi:hypothetical protein